MHLWKNKYGVTICLYLYLINETIVKERENNYFCNLFTKPTKEY